MLERCVALLERLERRAALGATPAAGQLAAPTTPSADLHAERDRYVASSDADQKAYERELFLLSPQDVLDRFGRPDDIDVSDRLVRWRWTWTEGDDTRVLNVSFANGYVCGMSAY
ncbi:MAG: hypothetical protein H6828_07085 [Planctomycetes bacterium]|nr:hypothetical protein [Planctomycetota bacterium]